LLKAEIGGHLPAGDLGLRGKTVYGSTEGLVEPVEQAAAGAPSGAVGARPPSQRDSRRRRLLAITDIVALCSAYGVVWLLAPPGGSISSKFVLGAALPAWILLNKLLGLYDRDANVLSHSTIDELPRIAQSVVLGSSLVFLLGPLLFPSLHVHRLQTLVFVAAALITEPAFRSTARWIFERHSGAERCLIVGSGDVAQSLVVKLTRHGSPGAEIVGFTDGTSADIADGHDETNFQNADDVGEFTRICQQLTVDRVIIAFSSLSPSTLLGIVRAAKEMNLKVSMLPRLFEAMSASVEFEQVSGMTLIGLKGLSRTRSSLTLKRALDFTGAAVGLILLAPLFAATALAIRLDSRGPVFFRQSRIGRDDLPFTLYKFRTMDDGADALKPSLAHLNEATGPMFKIVADPRVTRVGRFLRRHSIDELPQLCNVLRGEMSLVGPRPLVPAEDSQIAGHHRSRLQLTPGLTGPWQVSGRSAIPFDEMVELDYSYVAQWSLWNDMKLLLRTAPVVLLGKGH
jgi:exopolysaccharide biosynthesis polyprenyl glycosylphosphotransferase